MDRVEPRPSQKISIPVVAPILTRSIVTKSPLDETRRPTRAEAEEAVRTLICWAGDDPGRSGMQATPAAVLESYAERFRGYCQNDDGLAPHWSLEPAPSGETVLLRRVPFLSHCEHHMVPFRGAVSIAYKPAETIASVDDLFALVDRCSRRLQSQERLTSEIASAVESALRPSGLAVVTESEHLCMTLRGIQKHGTTTVTMKFGGRFRDDLNEREQVLVGLLQPDDC